MPDGLIARLTTYLDLDAETLQGLRVVASPFSVQAGEGIFRQGEKSTGMYVVDRGRIVISARTPGDDALSMVELASGEIFGELSLLDDDDRSASATALTDATGWWISRTGFRGLLHSQQPVAHHVMTQVQRRVARRIRDTLARIAATSSVVHPLRSASTGQIRSLPVDAMMLSMLSAFSLTSSMLSPRWECLLTLGRCLELPRGTCVNAAPSSESDFPLLWVVRGAIRECVSRDTGLEQLWVSGPGTLAGVVGAIDGEPHPMVMQAAEDSLILALPADCLTRLHGLDPALYITLQELIGRQIALVQRRINRHLGRTEGLRRFNQGEGR